MEEKIFGGEWKIDYKNVLTGKTPVPAANKVLDVTKADKKFEMVARKANDNAYHDLILANQEAVPFNIIDKATTKNLPNKDSAAAWTALCKKYDSKTSATVVTLSTQYNRAKLENTTSDQEEWITYLEVLQARFNEM